MAARGAATGYGAAVELVQLEAVSDRQWREIVAGEREPWGGLGESLLWRERSRQLGIRAADGRLVALASAAIAEVEVERAGFPVLGVGGVFVTPSRRGQGLAARLVGELLAGAPRGARAPRRAMLFCRPELTGMYGKLGFREIAAPVWVDQPRGRIAMPMTAMWHPLRDGVGWPSGRVDVRGLPF